MHREKVGVSKNAKKTAEYTAVLRKVK